jgi:hypothetical protein
MAAALATALFVATLSLATAGPAVGSVAARDLPPLTVRTFLALP